MKIVLLYPDLQCMKILGALRSIYGKKDNSSLVKSGINQIVRAHTIVEKQLKENKP